MLQNRQSFIQRLIYRTSGEYTNDSTHEDLPRSLCR
jgi:hypothetical protein